LCECEYEVGVEVVEEVDEVEEAGEVEAEEVGGGVEEVEDMEEVEEVGEVEEAEAKWTHRGTAQINGTFLFLGLSVAYATVHNSRFG
jgi:hypothetical protein